MQLFFEISGKVYHMTSRTLSPARRPVWLGGRVMSQSQYSRQSTAGVQAGVMSRVMVPWQPPPLQFFSEQASCAIKVAVDQVLAVYELDMVFLAKLRGSQIAYCIWQSQRMERHISV